MGCATVSNSDIAENVDGIVGMEECGGGGEVYEEGDARLTERCVKARLERMKENQLILFFHMQDEYDGTVNERGERTVPGPARCNDGEEDQAIHCSRCDQCNVDVLVINGIH